MSTCAVPLSFKQETSQNPNNSDIAFERSACTSPQTRNPQNCEAEAAKEDEDDPEASLAVFTRAPYVGFQSAAGTGLQSGHEFSDACGVLQETSAEKIVQAFREGRVRACNMGRHEGATSA